VAEAALRAADAEARKQALENRLPDEPVKPNVCLGCGAYPLVRPRSNVSPGSQPKKCLTNSICIGDREAMGQPEAEVRLWLPQRLGQGFSGCHRWRVSEAEQVHYVQSAMGHSQEAM